MILSIRDQVVLLLLSLKLIGGGIIKVPTSIKIWTSRGSCISWQCVLHVEITSSAVEVDGGRIVGSHCCYEKSRAPASTALEDFGSTHLYPSLVWRLYPSSERYACQLLLQLLAFDVSPSRSPRSGATLNPAILLCFSMYSYIYLQLFPICFQTSKAPARLLSSAPAESEVILQSIGSFRVSMW